MTTARPRITARSGIDPITDTQLCTAVTHTTPGVTVEVSFDLHDHDDALAALDRAVADVRAQIQEAQ